MSRLTKGYLIALIGIVIWSTTGILIGYLSTNYHLPALLLAFWRNLLACLVLIPALLLIRRPLLHLDRAQLPFFALYGFILAIFNSTYTLSVQANGAAVATVLGYSSAAFTAILAWWLLKEKLGLPKVVAIILSLGGCVLVSNAYDPANWNLNPIGMFTGLGTGVLFAIYNLLGKESAKRRLNPWTVVFYSFAFSSTFIFLFNLLPFLPGSAGSISRLWPQLPINGWLVLLVLSFIPTVLGFGLYTTSMNYLPASVASLLATSEPAMTAAEAYIFLNERLTTIQVIGSLIILLAVIIVTLSKERG